MAVTAEKPPVERLNDRRLEHWIAFERAVRQTGHPFAPASAGAEALATAFAYSDFVAAACIRHAQMALDLIDSGDLLTTAGADRMAAVLAARLRPLSADAAQAAWTAQLKAALRGFRRREMVRIAVRDLAGMADLDETTSDLTAVASLAIDGALDLLYARMCAADGTPVDKNGRPQRLVVLGMGKLGAGELNFSSDVDLIFTFPAAGETRGGRQPLANADFFTRLCRHLIQAIGETTVDGFVFRVDTRLRPYGDGGPLVMNFDHMEDYYQFQGREWERYALIKASVVAGDRSAGRALLQRLQPFVYRRYLDFGVFESLREMKGKITSEVRRKGLDDNIKLGGGGIREVEFFGQMFQLIRGGVLPQLQQRAIQQVLATLSAQGLVPSAVCRELTAAYRFLRMSENRLQEADDRQTHRLPTEAVARLQLALSMGFEDWGDYQAALDRHRNRVRAHFERLLEPDADSGSRPDGRDATPHLGDAWSASVPIEERRRLLAQAGFSDGDAAAVLLDGFRAEPITRALSGAGKQRLDRLMPAVLEAAGRCDDPLTVLRRVLQLLKSIQRRISYIALLIEYPTALTHLVRLVSVSPWIAAFLSRHPVLLDELLDPRTLYTPPGPQTLRLDLTRRMAVIGNDDPEYQMENLCIFRQVNTLRVAASDITSVLPLMKVSDHLSWIAETILETVVDICWRHLTARHGRPSCTLDGQTCRRGFCVIGYGKLGGLELGYGSDLDLVFLHAADAGETRGGERPIDNAHFFARLGQRVVHMLTAHTAAGTLYEADMRLRPSGSSGLLVSHVNGFKAYQLSEAWTWEHQALIRARPITGDSVLKRAFGAIRKEVLCQPRPADALKAAVSEMREKMRANRLAGRPGQFDIKEDVGAMVDVEFLVQYLVLQHAAAHPGLTRWTDNVRLLQALTEAGILDGVSAYRLRHAYLIYRAVAHRLNLQERSTLIDGRRFRHLKALVHRLWRQTLA